MSPYNYSMNNPVMMNDPSGMQGEKVEAGYASGKGSYEQPIDLNPVSVKPKSTASAADNTSVYQINPELLRGAQEREAAQKAIDEQSVLMADIYGNAHIGPRAQTEAKVRGIQKEYNDAVGANIAGGFFGALGYLIAGDQGSFAGAGVDNATHVAVATMSVARPIPFTNNTAKARLEPEVKSAPVPQRQQPVSTPVEGTVFRTTGNLAFTPEAQPNTSVTTRVWEVGLYKNIKGVEKGLDAHHVGQKAIMSILIPGYNLNSAPAILVPAEGHTFLGPVGMVSRNTKGFTNPRQVVARDVFELRRVYGTLGIPNSALMNLINMNKETYPIPFIKPKR